MPEVEVVEGKRGLFDLTLHHNGGNSHLLSSTYGYETTWIFFLPSLLQEMDHKS